LAKIDYARSNGYNDEQNVALANRALKLCRIMADRNFLQFMAGDDAPDIEGWNKVAAANEDLRIKLDLLLDTGRATEGKEFVHKLACSVEVVALPSFRATTQCFKEAEGYVIGYAPFSDVIGELAALAYLARVCGDKDKRDAIIRFAAKAINSMLVAQEDGSEGIVTVRSKHSNFEDPSKWTSAQVWETEFFDLATSFAIAHELAHIERDHFSSNSRVTSGFFARFPAGLSEEVEADCWTYSAMSNLFILKRLMEFQMPEGSRLVDDFIKRNRISDRTKYDVIDQLAMQLSAATFEGFYASIEILTRWRARKPDDVNDIGHDLRQIAIRRRALRKYSRWYRRHVLAKSGRLHAWRPEDWIAVPVYNSFRVQLDIELEALWGGVSNLGGPGQIASLMRRLSMYRP